MNELKNISKRSFVFGLLGLFIILPCFIYGFATVSYIGDKSKEISTYYLQFLFEPIIMSLIILLALNIIADVVVYVKSRVILLKKILLLFNIAYILFLGVKFIPENGQMADVIFFIIFLGGLFYKCFRYFQYYKKFIKI